MKIKFKNKKCVKKKKNKKKGKWSKEKESLTGEGSDCIAQAIILFHSQWRVGIFVFIVFIDHSESCRREQSRAEKDQSKSKSNGSDIEQDREGESKTWGSYILLETRLCLLPPRCPFHFFLFYFLYNLHFYFCFWGWFVSN